MRVFNSDGVPNRFRTRPSLDKHMSQDETYGDVEARLPKTHTTVSPPEQKDRHSAEDFTLSLFDAVRHS